MLSQVACECSYANNLSDKAEISYSQTNICCDVLHFISESTDGVSITIDKN